MKYYLIIFCIVCCSCVNRNKTEVSLFLRADSSAYLTEISSETGDLFSELGHHGPAIENEWMSLRIYFDKKAAIDVYSKSRPGLELLEARWYPTPEQQQNGWGADYYKAGTTVGLGGVRLWDGEKVVPLDPVTNRYAAVSKEGSSSYMEMRSEGIPYKDGIVDVIVRVTVYSGKREAKVEAMVPGGDPVQFVTGINYHNGQKVSKGDNYIATWGLHPEDVAVESVELGAAIIFDPGDFEGNLDDSTQYLIISKPAKSLETWITSACGKGKEINTLEDFLSHVSEILIPGVPDEFK
ncbi:MAG: DUF4861 family protein [Bacteroidales bacterium]|nr:DUF4861 family protein [Bacteroidales bacterium]